MERRDEMNLDVNDVLALMRKYLPRGRWLLLNSEFFGPLFSLSHYIGVSPAGIERVLEPVQWFQHMLRGADKWLHKPTVRARSTCSGAPPASTCPTCRCSCGTSSGPRRARAA